MIINGKPVSVACNSTPLEFTPAGPGRLPAINTTGDHLDKLVRAVGAERGVFSAHPNGTTLMYHLTREQLTTLLVRVVSTAVRDNA